LLTRAVPYQSRLFWLKHRKF
jgi:hypothetical protein